MVIRRWGRVLLLAAALSLTGCSGERALADLDQGSAALRPCPDSPNCVSSLASDESHRVDPLRYRGDPLQAQQNLLHVLRGMDRQRIVRADAQAIHVEFRSALFSFVDDVNFRFEPRGVIQIRSASRFGYSDFGVNRQRVETIRTRFYQADVR